MALEASDLNDGQILQQTRQVTDERGNIQFNITLPSGRTLKSEFMRKDDARSGMRKWLDIVKEQAVADSNAERLERAARAKRGKMDIERKPGDDQPLFRAGGARGPIDEASGKELPLPGPMVFKEATQPPVEEQAKGSQYPIDPVSFAQQQLLRTQQKADELSAQAAAIYHELDAVKAVKAKWSKIVKVLEENDDV